MTLMPLVSVTGLVLLLLTAAPTSCNRLTPGSHLPPFSRGEVKGEDTSAPGVVIDNAVDVKSEGFVEKETKAEELTESALKDDVLQTLETTGLNADNHDGLPPLQSVEQGTKVTSSRHARSPQTPDAYRPFRKSFKYKYISPGGNKRYSKRGTYRDADRDYKSLTAKASSKHSYSRATDKYGQPSIIAVNHEKNTETEFSYTD